MNKVELQNQLAKLREELDDMEETFRFNLSNTSAHINSGMVAEHEEEMEELKNRIARIEAQLA